MTAPAIDRRSDYVSAVAVELQDLDASDRAELIEELDDHIAALLVDRPDVDLVAELGSPRDYALELRAAAGLVGTGRVPQTLGQTLRALAERVGDVGRAVTPRWLDRLLPDVRPAWWVLRGYLVAIIAAQFLRAGHTNTLDYLWPTYDSHRWPAVVFIAVLVLLSVRLGRWRPREAWVGMVIVLGNIAVVLASALMYSNQLSYGDDYGLGDGAAPAPTCDITNLYPRDSSGRALSGVSLYDQNGNPVNLGDLGCPADGNVTTYTITSAAASGAPNTYPLTPDQPAGVVPATSAAAPSGSASAAPSASPTATPSGSPVPSAPVQDTAQGVPTR